MGVLLVLMSLPVLNIKEFAEVKKSSIRVLLRRLLGVFLAVMGSTK